MRWWASLIALTGTGATAPTADVPNAPAWTQPAPPFHVVGPIWYVGTQGLASYLIKTPAGGIVIDGTLAANVPGIERNLAAVGVPVGQVKLLLLTHAHFDHAAGLARLQRDSGARLAVGLGDAEAVRTGVPPSEVDYGVVRFPPARVTQPVANGGTVSLGGVTLSALATPGHTPGCTSWTMRVVEAGRPHEVIFLCSLTVAGNRLFGNRRYPGIVADFGRSFDRLDRTRADIVLPAHPEIADVRGRAQAGTLVAPDLLPHIVADARAAFAKELVHQRAATEE
jgi:metallo-beta-lactamase class B